MDANTRETIISMYIMKAHPADKYSYLEIVNYVNELKSNSYGHMLFGMYDTYSVNSISFLVNTYYRKYEALDLYGNYAMYVDFVIYAMNHSLVELLKYVFDKYVSSDNKISDTEYKFSNMAEMNVKFDGTVLVTVGDKTIKTLKDTAEDITRAFAGWMLDERIEGTDVKNIYRQKSPSANFVEFRLGLYQFGDTYIYR